MYPVLLLLIDKFYLYLINDEFNKKYFANLRHFGLFILVIHLSLSLSSNEKDTDSIKNSLLLFQREINQQPIGVNLSCTCTETEYDK